MSSPHSQSQYQVRFDWGREGAAAIAEDADVVVIVDVLSFCTEVDLAVAAGGTVTLEQDAAGTPAIALAHAHGPALVVAGSLRNATAVAEWALGQQGDKGDRFTIALVAAGEPRADGSTRFALEDLLGAGAIIDALADVGIDYCSPEAAAAAASFTGLRNATGHLIGASAGGRELAATAGRSGIDLAIERNVSQLVPVLREFTFVGER